MIRSLSPFWFQVISLQVIRRRSHCNHFVPGIIRSLSTKTNLDLFYRSHSVCIFLTLMKPVWLLCVCNVYLAL